jgi:hypothetical protein
MRTKLSFSLLLIAMLLGACKKDNSLEVQMPEASIMTKSALEQVKYAEVNLKKIANTIGKLTKKPEFVNFVHTEVAKKFDGQFEVLVEHLLKSPIWGTQLNTQELNEGLNAFKNLEGSNFYPQIYIPKMQNDADNHVSNFTTNNTTNLEDVKVVVYGGELAGVPENALHSSYSVNEDGELIPFQNIGEPYANENEVWIFSVNEIVTNDGRLALPDEGNCGPSNPDYPNCLSGGGGGGGSTGGSSDIDPDVAGRLIHPSINTNNPINCKIQNMVVKKHKEYWAAGGSEIAIRSALNTINGYINGDPSLGYEDYYANNSTPSFRGALLKWFSRSDIRNEASINVDFPLQNGWPTNILTSGPVYLDYVIFERDQWPTGKQILERKDVGFWFYNAGNPEDGYISHTYRSADIYYDLYRITNYPSAVTPNVTYLPSPYNQGATGAMFYNGTSRDSYYNSITFNVIGY